MHLHAVFALRADFKRTLNVSNQLTVVHCAVVKLSMVLISSFLHCPMKFVGHERIAFGVRNCSRNVNTYLQLVNKKKTWSICIHCCLHEKYYGKKGDPTVRDKGRTWSGLQCQSCWTVEHEWKLAFMLPPNTRLWWVMTRCFYNLDCDSSNPLFRQPI